MLPAKKAFYGPKHLPSKNYRPGNFHLGKCLTQESLLSRNLQVLLQRIGGTRINEVYYVSGKESQSFNKISLQTICRPRKFIIYESLQSRNFMTLQARNSLLSKKVYYTI